MSSRSRSGGAAPGVAFSKYSAFGNHFVLVDEIGQPALSEPRKRAFARRAADAFAGIGADNVIFLQPCDDKSLAAIRRVHRQWGHRDVAASASPRFIARFFEPDGAEFLTCGNGLTCIANHLVRTYGIASAQVLVEVPSRQPRFCAVEYPEPDGRGEVHLQWDLSRIEDFVRGSFAGHRERGLLFFSRQPIVGGASPWIASGLLVYSGEPHMVLIQPEAASSFAWPPAMSWEWTLPDLFADTAFAGGADGANPLAEMGMHANRPRGRDFPLGINVSAARVVDGGRAIEYRTFERGILRETLACGTGALAVAVAARRLGLVRGERVRLIPALGRRHPRYRRAEIVVRHRDDGTSSLSSKAEHVFSGTLPE